MRERRVPDGASVHPVYGRLRIRGSLRLAQ